LSDALNALISMNLNLNEKMSHPFLSDALISEDEYFTKNIKKRGD
jgi:hypothetical protein